MPTLAKARLRHHHHNMPNSRPPPAAQDQDWIVNEFARLVAARIGEPGQDRFLALLRDELKKTVQEEVQRGVQRSDPQHAELLLRMDKLEAAQLKLWNARKEMAVIPRPEPDAIATAEPEHIVYEAASPWRRFLLPSIFVLGLLCGLLGSSIFRGKPEAGANLSNTAPLQTQMPSAAPPQASLPPSETSRPMVAPGAAFPLTSPEQDKLKADFLRMKLEANAGRTLGCSTTMGDCLKIYNIEFERLEQVGKNIERLPDANIRNALTFLSIQALARAKLIPSMPLDGKPSARTEQLILDTGCSQRLNTQWNCLLDKSLGLR
jgi:hypothetical protein